MDIDIARHVLRAAFRSARELQDLLPLLKATMPAEEYDVLARGIASAIAEIGLEVTNRALAAHPALETEVETEVQRFGKYL